MSVSHPQKTVTPAAIDCRGTAQVTISFDAAAELAGTPPADVVLVLDRSNSIRQEMMHEVKAAVRDLIRTVADASGSTDPKRIGNGYRMALVSFGDEAKLEHGLSDNAETLRRAVEQIQVRGRTNHAAAFSMARQLLGSSGNRLRKVLLFTDGLTNLGGDPDPVVQAMKDDGVEIFCVGLLQDTSQLAVWASEPKRQHLSSTTDYHQLFPAFTMATAEVVKAGARDVVIREELEPDFQVLRLLSCRGGVPQITGPQTVLWTLPHNGLYFLPTTAHLTFEIRHIGEEGGWKPVNRSLTYRDRAGHVMEFPSPKLTVTCPRKATVFQVPGCRDAVQVRLSAVQVPPDTGKPPSA